MMRRRDVRLPVLAFTTSLLMHAILLIALPMAIDAATPQHENPNPAEQFQAVTLPVELRLGIEEPTPVSDTWLGDAEPEPHLAEPAVIDQAAFAANEPSSDAPLRDVEPAPETVAEAEEAAADHVVESIELAEVVAASQPEVLAQSPEEDVEFAPAPDAEPTMEPLAPAVVDLPQPDVEAVAERVKQLLELIQEALVSATSGPVPSEQIDPAPQPTKEPAPHAQPNEASPEVGTPSDKQSTPTSVIDVPREQWHLGRPLASHGLNLKPQRPRFELLTLITAAPGNPLCQINFGRDGVPVSATLLRSSGDPRVDEAVLASLYRWRAEGAALQSLPEGEVLEVQIRILLTRRKVD